MANFSTMIMKRKENKLNLISEDMLFIVKFEKLNFSCSLHCVVK
jgi:hypothetical protein